MSDKRFDEVVTDGQSIGYDKDRGYRALCSECGEYQECRAKEYERTNMRGATYIPQTVGEDEFSYVAKMRAWLCCHEDEVPLDGFPDDPSE